MYQRLRDDISIDGTKCSLCGRCVRNCPAGNLFQSSQTVKARGRCVLCLRCYSFCPETAVAYMGKLHDPGRGVPYRGPAEDFSPELLRPGPAAPL
jgi:ferredoxin